MIIRTLEEQVYALAAYLPGGRLFSAKNTSTSNLYLFLKGVAGEMLTSDGLIKAYRNEIIPDLTEKFINEWESAVGIPDTCFPVSNDLVTRRSHVLIKLASLGAQTTEEMQAIVDLFTNSFTIGHGTDKFTITMGSSLPLGDLFPLTFPVTFGSGEVAIAECLIRKIAPANVRVLSYEITPWDVEFLNYNNISLDISSEELSPQGMFFKDDGTKLYISGAFNDRVYQYSLPTPWLITGAVYDFISLDVSTEMPGTSSIFFKPDGLKMYILDLGTDFIFQYTLSTAWDLSTASYDTISFGVAAQDTSSEGIFFKDDGLKMYMVGKLNDMVYQYTLSTAWDISTASYDTISFGIAAQDTESQCIFFKPDGLKMYMIGQTNDTVYQYTLGTAWDISTASYASKSFSMAAQEDLPKSIFFKPDGTRVYMVGLIQRTIYQYSL